MGILADSSGGGGGVGLLIALYVVFYFIGVLPLWFIFKKAGQAEWKALIPIWNTIVLLEIVGRPIWWIVLLIIPCVNIVIWIIVAYDLAKSFGHGGGFTLGLVLLTWIFLMILAFSQDRYLGPAAAAGQAPPPAVA